MERYDQLARAVLDLEPLLRESSARAEADRRMPDETVAALRSAGFFKLWVPQSLGGWEVDPVTAYRVFEDIAAIDSAAGWLVKMSNVIGVANGWLFGDQAVEEIFDGDHIYVDSFSVPARAQPVADGFRVTGRVPFVSNCHHAEWIFVSATVMDGDEPRLVNGERVEKSVAFRIAEAEIVDNWDTLGMRGTGSHDVRFADVFVPEHRATPMAPIAGAANKHWPIGYANMTVWFGVPAVSLTPLGIARTAIDCFIDLCKSKIPAFEDKPVGDQLLAQYRLGEARAILGAARALVYETVARVWESAVAGNFITMEQRADLQMAGSYATRAACDAIELLAASAGGNAMRESSPLTRHLRDLRTVTQHAYVSTNRYEDVGAIALGRKPRWGFLYF